MSVRRQLRRRIVARLGRADQFRRFLIIGIVNTGVTYGVYLLFLNVMPYRGAYTASYISGLALSYFLNVRFVFGESLRVSSALQYPLVYVGQYGLGLGLIYLLVDLARINKYVAPVGVLCLTVPLTYLFSRYIIRKAPRSRSADQRGPAGQL